MSLKHVVCGNNIIHHSLFINPQYSVTDIFVGDTAMNFVEAQDWCQQRGAELLSIHSNETQKEAKSLCELVNDPLPEPDNDGCWIGLQQNSTALGLYMNWVCSMYMWCVIYVYVHLTFFQGMDRWHGERLWVFWKCRRKSCCNCWCISLEHGMND